MCGCGRGGGRGKGEGACGGKTSHTQATQNEYEATSNVTENSSVAESDNVLPRVRIIQLKLLVSLLMYTTVACAVTLLDKVLLAVIGVHLGPTQMKYVLGFLMMPSLPLWTSVGMQFCSSALTRIQPSGRTKTRLGSGDANSSPNQLI